jgi:hypothetical protein
VLTNEVVRGTSFAVAYAQAKLLSLTASLGEQGTVEAPLPYMVCYILSTEHDYAQASPKLGYKALPVYGGRSFATHALRSSRSSTKICSCLKRHEAAERSRAVP